jgi:hypothetical protein
MPLIQVTVKHGRTLDDARQRLEMAVTEARAKLGALIHTVEWNAPRDSVKLRGPGVEIDMRVDVQELHVSGDVPLLSNLLKGPVVAGIKAVLERAFQRRLT